MIRRRVDSGHRPTDGPDERGPRAFGFDGVSSPKRLVEDWPALLGARGAQEDMAGYETRR